MRTLRTAVASFIALTALFSLPAWSQSWGQYKDAACEYMQENKFEQAEKMWKSSLELCREEASFGSRYFQSLRGLASAYSKQEKFSDAEVLYKSGTQAMDRGTDYATEVLPLLKDYSEMLRKTGRTDEANNLDNKYSLVSSGTTGSAGSQLLSASEPRNVEAEVQDSLRKSWNQEITAGNKEFMAKHYPQCEAYFKSSLTYAEKLGTKDPAMAESLKSLIILYSAQERYDLVNPLYVRALALIKERKGEQSQEYAQTLKGRGMVLRKLGKKQEAMICEARADQILQQFIVPDKKVKSSSTDSLLSPSKPGINKSAIMKHMGAASGAAAGYGDLLDH